MLTHVVCFRYRADVPETARADHRARLAALDGAVPSLRSLVVGADVVRSPRSYDTALVTTFDDRAGLDAYAVHPAHLPVLALGRDLCADIVAVDFEG